MPRDSSGLYTLPPVNPVVDATVIETAWANPTLTDIAVQLNNLITRDGLLGATAPIGFVDGNAASPGITFAAQPNTGFYRAGANTIGVSVGGIQVGAWSPTGLSLAKDLVYADDAKITWGDGSAYLQGNGTTDTMKLAAGAGLLTLAPTSLTSSVQFLAADGTVALPGIAFAGGGGVTGLYRPATGVLGFVSGGTEKARITGNAQAEFLIGSTAPAAGSLAGRGLVNINGTSSSLLALDVSGAWKGFLSADAASINLGSSAALPMCLYSGAAEKARLTASADSQFLIGITAPKLPAAGRGVLEVNGFSESLLGLDINGVSAAYLYATASLLDLSAQGARSMSFTVNGAARWYIDASGNLVNSIAWSTGGAISLQQYSTSGGKDIAFLNRGNSATEGSTYNIGGIWAAGYRDVLDPAFIAGITFERTPTNGGASSAGSIVFRTDTVGQAKGSVSERARIDGAGIFTYQGTEVGWRRLPQSVPTTNYQFVASDAGKWIMGNGANITFTIPGATFVAGDTITVANTHATLLTITTASGNLIWGTGAGTIAPTRKVATYGVVTLLCAGANWFIKGDGIQ